MEAMLHPLLKLSKREQGVFCEAGASSGGRKSALYFDVSVSGRHIAYRSKFWKARREKGFKTDSYLHVLIHSNRTGHNG